MTSEAAQTLLDQARAWTSWGARALDRYLAQHPAALTNPPPDCPMALAWLLQLVAAAGYPVSSWVMLVSCRRREPALHWAESGWPVLAW
jgi:hypothetical protein